ncbi:MAG: M23 family metallopeptidase, partial [Clostridia bacterium]|nr:M23 family metallopeptidase [Clostridia bacterium]
PPTEVVNVPIDDPVDDLVDVPVNVIPDPIVFASPVATVNIIRDYTMDTLVFHTTLNQWSVSTGIDFGGEEGAAVAAAYGGVVESVTYDALNGHKVVIKHNDDLRTIYYSLKEATVTQGQTVTKAQSIGSMGTTASSKISDGPLVHFEVTLKNVIADPYEYLDIGDK